MFHPKPVKRVGRVLINRLRLIGSINPQPRKTAHRERPSADIRRARPTAKLSGDWPNPPDCWRPKRCVISARGEIHARSETASSSQNRLFGRHCRDAGAFGISQGGLYFAQAAAAENVQLHLQLSAGLGQDGIYRQQGFLFQRPLQFLFGEVMQRHSDDEQRNAHRQRKMGKLRHPLARFGCESGNCSTGRRLAVDPGAVAPPRSCLSKSLRDDHSERALSHVPAGDVG